MAGFASRTFEAVALKTSPLRFFERSMVARLGGAIAAIALLALLGMSVSSMVALSTRGSGEAINLAGSLRMQSWKMTALYLAQINGDPHSNRVRLREAIETFESTLAARPIADMLPGSSELDLAGSYRQVRDQWYTRIKPRFLAVVQGAVPTPDEKETAITLAEVGAFVDTINNLVKQMELATEAKIKVMQIVLGTTLVLTVLVVLLTVYLIHTGLVQPLRTLLAFSSRVGQGDLTVRTEHTGEDELGRLGQAFNAMAEDLSKLYADLEGRVRQKTAELTQSNQSLELLYQSIARLHGAPPGRETYLSVLRDIERVLGLGHGLICLGERGASRGEVVASTLEAGDANPCERALCAWCHGTDTPRASITPRGDQLLTLPLSDAERQYGVMILDIPHGSQLEAWQIQLLEALSRHIGVAIGAERRIEQGRRLSLLEERAVIARELHDSLAQSLAYMKIQVSRLQTALGRPDRQDEAAQILLELREGLNGAYRQLRELLTTFRLRMEGEDLASALAQTVQEFAERGGIDIALEIDRASCTLTPNEEIHVLHVVREALSNVINHAQARHALVRLACGPDGRMEAVVEDDGVGISKSAAPHHYGMTIMEERARTLHGELRCESRPGGGTRVVLAFLPTCQTAASPLRRIAS
jgi:two-component system nitrate/nitrite sensor histidine kinase NarX